MPWDEVMSKWKSGSLKSGTAKVTSQKQAIAIMLSEKKKSRSNPEYATNLMTAIKKKASNG